MNVIVTGGRGFIGSRVVALLKARGDKVSVIDKEDGLSVLHASSFSDGYDAVIHLAGVLGTAELFQSPFSAVDVNVRGSLTVLEACKNRHMAYVGITMPDVWPNLYQATKTCAAEMAVAYHFAYGVPVSHVRAFNVFGPDQKTGVDHPQKIIPTFSTKAWRNIPLPIWGDGLQTVDLVHVDDVARMLVDALDYGDCKTFDAGTGTEMTVNAVADWVLKVTGSTAGVVHEPMRAGETERTSICARGEGWDLLGWRPRFSADRLAEVIESFQPVRVA